MSRIQLALLTGGALVIVGAALVTWRTRHSPSPLESLQQLEHAVRAKDRPGIARFLDVRRAAESVVDEALSTAAAAAPAESSSSEEMRASLVNVVELSFWTALLDSLATLEGRYRGLAGVEERGGVARVGVRIQLENLDSPVVVRLRMDRTNGHWRVVGVEDLARHLWPSVERRRERGYEAALRANLWNVATAQDAYHASHATYTRSLEALTYDPTPGVRLEIIDASGTGWRAVARHEAGTAECRIGVGTGVPPGGVEREVKCSVLTP